MAQAIVELPSRMQAPCPAPKTLIVLGSDGSGKTSTIAALVEELVRDGISARFVANPAGRRWFTRQTTDRGFTLPVGIQDFFESIIRTVNVARNSFSASRFAGLTVMDRHLHCQLVLRRLRGQPSGLLLPRLTKFAARDTQIVVLDLDPAIAQARIVSRDEDFETLDYLAASRQEYLTLAEEEQWTVIDSSQTIAETVQQIRAMLGIYTNPHKH